MVPRSQRRGRPAVLPVAEISSKKIAQWAGDMAVLLSSLVRGWAAGI